MQYPAQLIAQDFATQTEQQRRRLEVSRRKDITIGIIYGAINKFNSF